MNIKQENKAHTELVSEKTRVSVEASIVNKESLILRKPSIYKGLLGIHPNNLPAILYYIPSTDIVTKYTRVNKWKPIAGLIYREKNIRKFVAYLSKVWYNSIIKQIYFLFAKSTINDSGLRVIPTNFNQLITRKVFMHYSYDKLSVSDVAKLLDTETTYIYKLVRDGQLKTCSTNPIRIERVQVHFYLNKRLPSQFTTEWKHKPKEATQWIA